MTAAAAFFVSLAAGVGVGIVLLLWSAWTLRSGKRSERAKKAMPFVIFPLVIGVPLALAIWMPDFKRAIVAWLGFGIGFALSKVVTLPLGYVLAKRIERRRTATNPPG